MDFLFRNVFTNKNHKKQRSQLILFTVVLSLVMYFFYLGIAFYSKFYQAIALICIAIFILLISLLLIKSSVKLRISSNLSLLANNFLAFSCMYLSGGIHSPVMLWLIIPPITALLITNRITAFVWFVISLIEVGFLIFLDYYQIKVESTYDKAYDDFYYFASFAGVMCVVSLISVMFEKMINSSRRSLDTLNSELMLKNEELNIQTEEISSQRDMLYEMTHELEAQKSEVVVLNQQLEVRIQQRTNELYLALKELDTFIYRSAHDIKGPLSTISGLCYVAMFDVKDPKSANYLAKIQAQTQKTIHLLQRISGINELKSVQSKIKKIDFKLINLKLNRYIQEEQEEIQHVKLSISIQEEVAEFYTDQQLVELIVIDLIDNAVKFRDSFKAEEAYVNFSISVRNNFLNIVVEDNGLGIEENIKQSIFDMFFKGSEKSKGSGLGLFIVKIALEKLNGEVTLDSTLKDKTIFKIQIPNAIDLMET